MELSIRAKRFLAKQERLAITTVREDILESFISNNAPVFEPLIEFQQKYGGYQFMAGLAPIHFGLLQGDGGYPTRTGSTFIDFSLSDTEDSRYQFVCATSQYQMEFTLDEFGRYYEDYEIVASSFDKLVEHLSIWDEIRADDNLKIFVKDHKFSIQDLDKKLGLALMPEASDAYTLWFKNQSTYLTQCNGWTTIVSTEDFETINALIK